MLVSTGTAPRWSSTGVTADTGTAYNVLLANTLTASANSDFLFQLSVGSAVFAKSTFTSLSAFGIASVGANWSASGAGTISNAFAFYASPPTIGTNNWVYYATGGNSVIAAGVDSTTSGIAFIGDNANTFMTSGLTINQQSNSNEIIALKQSGVAHGITTLAETDTLGTFAVRDSGTGGLRVVGYTEGATGLHLNGYGTTDDTNKNTSAQAYVMVEAAKKSGTSTTAPGSNANMVAFRDGLAQTQFIFDAEGDSHQNVGTAWTNFDDHEDAELLTALSVHVSRDDDPIRTNFGDFLKSNREKLEALKLVTFNEDGHHFVNMSKLTMLLVGAVRQQATRYNEVLERLNGLETRLIAAGA